MNYELALKLEQEGDFVGAYYAYLSLVDSSAPSIQTIRGLVRTTIRVGDIVSQIERLEGYCDDAKISKDLSFLLLAKLNCEIGNISNADKFILSIDESQLSENDLFDCILVKIDVQVAKNDFEKALSQIRGLKEINIGLMRRQVELEVAIGKPTDAIKSLKNYVTALNLQQTSQGKSGNFRTASGMLFNLANQIWLDQKFGPSKTLPTLYESMQTVKSYVDNRKIQAKSIFNPTPKANTKSTNWTSIKGIGSRQKQIKVLMDFLAQGITESTEFLPISELNWQEVFHWNGEVSYFFCEESGYVSSSCFGLVGLTDLSHLWANYVIEIGEQRTPNPSDLFIGGALITRLLASQIEKGNESFRIYSRSEIRKYRSLPPRYSTALN